MLRSTASDGAGAAAAAPPLASAPAAVAPAATQPGQVAQPLQSWTASTIAAPPQEIMDIKTSRYNHDYYCTVKRARQTGPTSVAIDFIEVGDHSLGDLQNPMASTVR